MDVKKNLVLKDSVQNTMQNGIDMEILYTLQIPKKPERKYLNLIEVRNVLKLLKGKCLKLVKEENILKTVRR